MDISYISIFTIIEINASSPRRGFGSDQIKAAIWLNAASTHGLVVRQLAPAENKLLPLQLQSEAGIGTDVLLDLTDRRVRRHIARNRYPIVLDVYWLGRFNSAHGICIILVNLRGATELRLEPAEEKRMRKDFPKLPPGIHLPQISYRVDEPFLADTESDVRVLTAQSGLSKKVKEMKIVISA